MRSGGGFASALAPVGAPWFHQSVADAPDIWDLLDRLDAAADDGANIHNDLCTVFRDGEPCSCGIPDLLRDAAEFVRSAAVEDAIKRAAQLA